MCIALDKGVMLDVWKREKRLSPSRTSPCETIIHE